jgi:hypothetical protein
LAHEEVVFIIYVGIQEHCIPLCENCGRNLQSEKLLPPSLTEGRMTLSRSSSLSPIRRTLDLRNSPRYEEIYPDLPGGLLNTALDGDSHRGQPWTAIHSY